MKPFYYLPPEVDRGFAGLHQKVINHLRLFPLGLPPAGNFDFHRRLSPADARLKITKKAFITY
jgi:hypothetical protein